MISDVLKHELAIFLGFFFKVFRNLNNFIFSTKRLIIPNNAIHVNEINNALKILFSSDRNLDRNWISTELLTHLIDNIVKVSTGTVHLIHKCHTGHFILVGLTPNSFGLRLYSAY